MPKPPRYYCSTRRSPSIRPKLFFHFCYRRAVGERGAYFRNAPLPGHYSVKHPGRIFLFSFFPHDTQHVSAGYHGEKVEKR